MIRGGRLETAIAGGTEAVVAPTCIAGFNAMKALSIRNDDPQRASRPFDRDRDGFVVAEGAGIVILEKLEPALARGASIYAEVVGYGSSSDAFHLAQPAPDGGGATRCMRTALADAGLDPAAIQYINAHGTGTPLNDVLETEAIKTVFGPHAARLAVQFHQVDDRPPARRRGRDRNGHHRLDHSPCNHTAHHQPRSPGPGL